jgi:hypothetical protein
MRKISQTLATVGALVAIAVPGGANVSAAGTCPVGYTGPGSTNICTSTETYECTVTNGTQVMIDNQNAQGSISGNAGGVGNGGVGGAQTGTATNSNGATFNFEVTNGSVCTAVRTVPATPAQPQPQTSSPSSAPAPQEATGSGSVAAPVQAKPTVLANTSSGTQSALPFIALGSIGAAAVGVRAAMLYYQRYNM